MHGNELGGILVESNNNDIGPGNSVHDNVGDGIQVTGGPLNDIHDNGDGSPGGIHDNLGVGIYLTDGADDNDVQRNDVVHNGDASGEAGIRVDSDINRIFHNHGSGNTTTCGILLGFEGAEEADGNEVWLNEVFDNIGYTGIRLRGGSSGNEIHHNDVYNNVDGIRLHEAGTTGNTIHDNTFNENLAQGIRLDDPAHDNIVVDNTANDNAENGIKVASDGNTIGGSGNTAEGNTHHGIFLTTSANQNDVGKNKLTDNVLDGIHVEGTNNDIVNNHSKENHRHGISVDDASAPGNLLLLNKTSHNLVDGINFASVTSGNTAFKNHANFNGDDGIEDLGTNTCPKGGGPNKNHAKHNVHKNFVGC